MPFASNPLGEFLSWTGWLSNGWKWAFSPRFRQQKRARWRELPRAIVVLDATASCAVWAIEISLAFLLVHLAFRG